jgi:hypothetical protein
LLVVGGDRELRAPTVVLAVLAALACGPKDREVRLERLAAERRALDKTFDHLEDRLVVNQARVRFWNEMRERHESVSAIACAVQGEHADAMASRALPPPARSSLDRARVATAPRDHAAERVPAAAGGGPAGGVGGGN